jgi:hypothetical protein
MKIMMVILKSKIFLELKNIIKEIIKNEIIKKEKKNINNISLYPNEKILFKIEEKILIKNEEKLLNKNEEIIINDINNFINLPTKYDNKINLPIPKLSLQYLNFEDYLNRNFILYQLETNFEIKKDIEENIKKMKIILNENTNILQINGWSNYCLPIKNFYYDDTNISKIFDSKSEIITGINNFINFNYKKYYKNQNFIKEILNIQLKKILIKINLNGKD